MREGLSHEEFENYLTLLSRTLQLRRGQSEAVVEELRLHLEERLDELTSRGVTPKEAINLALGDFGDATALANKFVEVSRLKTKLVIMRSVLVGLFVATAVLAGAMAFWSSRDSNPASLANAEPALKSNASPDGPNAWDSRTTIFIGKRSIGNLEINNGSEVLSGKVYAGFKSDGSGRGGVGKILVEGNGSTWTNNIHDFCRFVLGYEGGLGMLEVTNGGKVNSYYTYVGRDWSEDDKTNILRVTHGGAFSSDRLYIGQNANSKGVVTIDGKGSIMTLTGTITNVGQIGQGTLNVTNGGAVHADTNVYIGNVSGSTGHVNVNGVGSKWIHKGALYVGRRGTGVMEITKGGLVCIAGSLSINSNSAINLSTGGMLAIYNKTDLSNSLNDFLGTVNGDGMIRYWDNALNDWVDITEATPNINYTLQYQSDGDLASYTILTVTDVCVPNQASGNVSDRTSYDEVLFQALAKRD